MKKFRKIAVERFWVDGTEFYVKFHDDGGVIRICTIEGEQLIGMGREEAKGLADLLIHLTEKNA